MGFNIRRIYMKNFNKSVIVVLLIVATLTSCGNSEKIPAEIPVSSSESEMPATQEAETETDTVEETTEAPTSAETTAVATTVPIEDREPKVNEYIEKYIDDWNEEVEKHYYFVPQEATELSDDINLGLITVDGTEFDITKLSDAYKNGSHIFSEQAGLYTTDRLIADGVFEDVHIKDWGSPDNRKFLFGEGLFFRQHTDIDVFEELYGFEKSKGIYDFITVEYVNDWFKGLFTRCFSENSKFDVEQITVNDEIKPFVEENDNGYLYQITENEDKLITYTEKNIAVGDGTTYNDLVAMFSAEPTYVDCVFSRNYDIYAYRNSTVTVGFVINDFQADEDWTEEKRNNAPVIALYMWLND